MVWLPEGPLPKRSFKIHAALLYKVNDTAHVALQANRDVHKGRVVIQFSSKEKDTGNHILPHLSSYHTKNM